MRSGRDGEAGRPKASPRESYDERLVAGSQFSAPPTNRETRLPPQEVREWRCGRAVDAICQLDRLALGGSDQDPCKVLTGLSSGTTNAKTRSKVLQSGSNDENL